MLLLISISCDTSSPEELDKNDILDIFDSIQLSFNIDDPDGIMQNYHQDFFHNGDTFDWERDVIWVSRLAEYDVLLFENIEINVNENYATASFLMHLDAMTTEEPDENGDLSYFYYDLGNWKVCGEGFTIQP